ncbi:hypothetical chaperone protein [Thalassovita litoralis]|jgi:hypothetical chaperone protein|uniref:Hypothetical chaperone protein n=1 Tax=Thalassovita litoralis TaxID=1010611 RepID=A0A521FQV0_9RHOB|nr:Hsp70 family protein [Thalassovita litoralis]SMO98573.1 hypothetical chaperone protein [Thalassovita litoralis]
MTAPVLAMDFGTSNSAVAILVDGKVQRLPVEADADSLPTAVFLPADGGPMRIGHAAQTALTDGEEGRYMRALKSVLGTSLFHEERMIAGRRRSIAGIVTALLSQVKAQAEQTAGTRFDRVLSGRPVHFHSADSQRDARAEADLCACYQAAGFQDVGFLPEPEAAALATGGTAQQAETRLIVDIGGGTSDFSVVRIGANGMEIVASHGIRLGGTDFDQAISMSHAMPLLGLGGELRRTFGEGLLPVPRALYADLATWAMIPFLYTRDTEKTVADLVRHAVNPAPLLRLADVIERRLGHDIAFAVEKGKIAANSNQPGACIDLGILEPGLSSKITSGMMNAALTSAREKLRAALYETFLHARIPPSEIESVILVGGSSLMSLVSDEALAVCPAARIVRADAFTAVVDGLALATKSMG